MRDQAFYFVIYVNPHGLSDANQILHKQSSSTGRACIMSDLCILLWSIFILMFIGLARRCYCWHQSKRMYPAVANVDREVNLEEVQREREEVIRNRLKECSNWRHHSLSSLHWKWCVMSWGPRRSSAPSGPDCASRLGHKASWWTVSPLVSFLLLDSYW